MVTLVASRALAALLASWILVAPAAARGGDLERALELLDLGRADQAAGLLLTRRDPALTYHAARALWAAGQRSSALARYLKVVLSANGNGGEDGDRGDRGGRDRGDRGDRDRGDRGDRGDRDRGDRGDRGGRAHLVAAARRLEELVAFPVEGTEQLAAQAKGLSVFAPAVRPGLAHRLGLYWLRLGKPRRASEVLQHASRRPAARYLKAVILLRGGQRGAAQRELRATLEVARRRGERDLAELAALALARIALGRGAFEEARALYRGIPYASPSFFHAQQELAWLHLRAGDPARALASSAVLSAPRLRRYYRPDRELVETAALLQLCRTAEARRRAQAAATRLKRDTKRLTRFLRPREDERLYYVEAMASAVRGEDGVHEDGELPGELVAALLADSGFRRAFNVVRQLQRERRLLLRPSGATLRRVLAKELDRRLVLAQRRAGATVKALFSRLVNELKDLRSRVQELQFDLDDQAVKRAIRRRSAGDQPRGSPGVLLRRPIAPQKKSTGRQQTWPFTGEYWSDEIPHFELEARSRCSS